MASGTLYTYPENFRAFKVLIAAQYGGGNVKLAPDFVFGESNKTKWFRQKFPLGKVPAFESTDGKLLTESNAIAYFVSSPQLRGESDTEKAQVLQWLCFADSEILPASCTWVFPCLSIMQFNKQAAERAKDDVKGVLTTLDKYLLTRTYLVGERVTLADIGVACTLLHLYQYVLEPDFRQSYKNVNRWFTTIVNQPQAKAVLGDFKLCEKAAEYDPKKFGEFQGKSKGKKVSEGESEKSGAGKKNKKEKGAGSEKKEPKRAASPPPDDEMDDLTNEILAAEPKTNDPFDLLPKGTFVIDEFKRCYSNEEEAVSIPHFWENFDKENYSIWLGEYKYNDELKKVFMSCNLITGMFQRLDKMRKCAFASVCLFGTDDDSTISGIWVWRGQGLAFEMSADWQVDYESYQWTKLDADKAETKDLVAQYFAWQGTDKDGRKFNQGKIFK